MKIHKYLMTVIWVLAVCFAPSPVTGDEKVLNRWSQKQDFYDKFGSELEVRATYYSAEYIEALVQVEAQKNLWTSDETEQYKYQLLKSLSLDEYIPIHIAFDNRGPAMHMSPFDKLATLWIGKNKVSPVDYDKRFNFRLQGKRDGLVFFPRYNEKGKPYLENAKTIRFSLSNAISSTTMDRSAVDFFWDVHRDNPEGLYKGRAAARLELDRLIKRIEKLNAEKRDLESKLNELNNELSSVNKRVEELQKQ
ncbi:hypothetical protein C8D99_101264 [Aminivibrio pyruvatiphilus]|uniref:Uncharacterized protein n=1 Tax=Aminivibrio pyruvatiphilus TaxID=1005740 RepID=A0A4R8MHN4_9BACT|nr:hypothetical protein [Aminivibrio pyruvatiphilus]TDY65114.1 hypothetical protein C8D99_101264 [Aminivibrio pyruvatiphilus]